MNLIEQMLSKYTLNNQADYFNALREIYQEIALAGLYRGGFFDKATFYGGTCLRIFYKLERFSEDLDFSLLKTDPDFSLQNYFEAIALEFKTLGLDVIITEKEKNKQTSIVSAFLKNNSDVYNLQVKNQKEFKIKLEVDTNPPLGFATEQKLLLQPFSFYVNCFKLADLFAGKMHVLLHRKWNNRVKGRDWYDFEWYLKNNVKFNLQHFKERALQGGFLKDTSLTKVQFLEILKVRINSIDFEQAKQDVMRFIKNPNDLDIWSQQYFLDLLEHLIFL